MSRNLSVLMPGYNEETRVVRGLTRLISFLQNWPDQCEIIFIDDGSEDKTAQVAHQILQEKDNCIRSSIIRHEKNEGKGWAVHSGVLAAHYDYILMTDVDLSTPLTEVYKLFEALETKQAQIAIGSKALNRSLVIKSQPWYREFLGRTFNILVRIFLVPNIVDTQRGFKLFRKEAVQELALRQTIKRWVFDVELLYLARRLGYKVVEVPVNWADNQASRVRVGHDLFETLRDLFLVWWRHRNLQPIQKETS